MIDLLVRYRYTVMWAAWVGYCIIVWETIEAVR
jgi:hypothetical protein